MVLGRCKIEWPFSVPPAGARKLDRVRGIVTGTGEVLTRSHQVPPGPTRYGKLPYVFDQVDKSLFQEPAEAGGRGGLLIYVRMRIDQRVSGGGGWKETSVLAGRHDR